MKTIGVLGTGDMGSAVGRVLIHAGYRVVTVLLGRSAESRHLAEQAGLENLATVEQLVEESDVFLSIVPPAVAYELAAEIAPVIARCGRSMIYADCNAVAPETVTRIERLFVDGPAYFVDVGIVGPAPRVATDKPTRFYVSGTMRQSVLSLSVPELRLIDMGDSIGRASAIKMCYAALNKGVDALYVNILLAAMQLGVGSELMTELRRSQAEAAARIERRAPFLAATAERYVGEMHEIAATFDQVGASGDFYRGAAWLYGVLARSSLSGETRATLPDHRSLDDAMAAYVAALEAAEHDRKERAGQPMPASGAREKTAY